MKKTTLTALILSALPAIALAHNIETGQKLPQVSVASHGELMLEGDEIRYQQWSSEQLTGKMRVVQAIAGRKSAKKLNAPMIDAIKAAKLPADKYQTTTIINQDDAMWGTGSFVKSSAEDSKKEFAWSSMVLDEEGNAAKAWQLDEESSAIILLDQQGQVLFVKDGEMNEQEINQVLEQIKKNL